MQRIGNRNTIFPEHLVGGLCRNKKCLGYCLNGRSVILSKKIPSRMLVLTWSIPIEKAGQMSKICIEHVSGSTRSLYVYTAVTLRVLSFNCMVFFYKKLLSLLFNLVQNKSLHALRRSYIINSMNSYASYIFLILTRFFAYVFCPKRTSGFWKIPW